LFVEVLHQLKCFIVMLMKVEVELSYRAVCRQNVDAVF
jgi:hypothetical protein